MGLGAGGAALYTLINDPDLVDRESVERFDTGDRDVPALGHRMDARIRLKRRRGTRW